MKCESRFVSDTSYIECDLNDDHLGSHSGGSGLQQRTWPRVKCGEHSVHPEVPGGLHCERHANHSGAHRAFGAGKRYLWHGAGALRALADAAVGPWRIIDDYGLDFYRGKVVEAILRRDASLGDLREARECISRLIETEKRKQ